MQKHDTIRVVPLRFALWYGILCPQAKKGVDGMEFHEKLQELRKQRALTQEELAAALYVSRTAVSKWESGRGYPNIDSLKMIAAYFRVTVDDLLSGDELLTIAEEDQKQKTTHLRDLVFGLLDLGAALVLFLPLFGQEAEGAVQAVSLWSLTNISPWLKTTYGLLVLAVVVGGVLMLALQNCRMAFWVRHKTAVSLCLPAVGVLLFIVSRQPYAAIFLFVFLAVKVLLLIKRQ